MTFPDLTIIIVTYNSAVDILTCLNSIETTKGTIQLEIIVVDNNSQDKTTEIVRDRFPQVHVIANEKNIGFPAANNKALERSSGNVILLLNPDTIVHKGALEELIAFFRARKSGAIVGLHLRNGDGTRQGSVHEHPKAARFILSLFDIPRLFSGFQLLNPDSFLIDNPANPMKVGWVSGSALALNREAVKALKGLEKRFFWMEDVDLCLRAYEKGIPVYFLPKSLVTHFGGESAKSNIGRVLFHQHISKLEFARTHFGRTCGQLVQVIFVIQLTVKIVVRFIQWIFSGQRPDHRIRIDGYMAAFNYMFTHRFPAWL